MHTHCDDAMILERATARLWSGNDPECVRRRRKKHKKKTRLEEKEEQHKGAR